MDYRDFLGDRTQPLALQIDRSGRIYAVECVFDDGFNLTFGHPEGDISIRIDAPSNREHLLDRQELQEPWSYPEIRDALVKSRFGDLYDCPWLEFDDNGKPTPASDCSQSFEAWLDEPVESHPYVSEYLPGYWIYEALSEEERAHEFMCEVDCGDPESGEVFAIQTGIWSGRSLNELLESKGLPFRFEQVFLECWGEIYVIRNIDPVPLSMRTVRECIAEDLEDIVFFSEDQDLNGLERKLHRLEPDDPLLRQATSAIAAERNARATEGPTERAGRQAMLDLNRRGTVELAGRLNEIRAALGALAADSPIRVRGERTLALLGPMLEQMQDRISVGDGPWTEPTPGEPLKVGDGFALERDGEHFHYGITAASPGPEGTPNPVLEALAQMAAEAELAEPAPAAGGDDDPDEV
jgi:hypothetical protein